MVIKYTPKAELCLVHVETIVTFSTSILFVSRKVGSLVTKWGFKAECKLELDIYDSMCDKADFKDGTDCKAVCKIMHDKQIQ